jgi:hypothetical protein
MRGQPKLQATQDGQKHGACPIPSCDPGGHCTGIFGQPQVTALPALPKPANPFPATPVLPPNEDPPVEPVLPKPVVTPLVVLLVVVLLLPWVVEELPPCPCVPPSSNSSKSVLVRLPHATAIAIHVTKVANLGPGKRDFGKVMGFSA